MAAASDSSSTEQRFAQIVTALQRHKGVTGPRSTGGRRGFGSSALKLDGKIFAMMSSKGAFVVKLSRARVDELVAAAVGERFDPGHGRVMKEWLAVRDESRSDWLALAREALTHARIR